MTYHREVKKYEDLQSDRFISADLQKESKEGVFPPGAARFESFCESP